MNPLFDGIRKKRDPAKCLYEGRTFIWTFILGFLGRMGSRNSMDALRDDERWADAVHKLAEQDLWDGAPSKTR